MSVCGPICSTLVMEGTRRVLAEHRSLPRPNVMKVKIKLNSVILPASCSQCKIGLALFRAMLLNQLKVNCTCVAMHVYIMYMCRCYIAPYQCVGHSK